MKKCIIIVNINKKGAVDTLKAIIDFLNLNNIDVITFENNIERKKEYYYEKYSEEIKACDFVISLGGDGNLLFTARLFSKYNKPIIGVHLGTFGFITEITIDEIFDTVKKFCDGKAEFEKRVMVCGTVKRNGEPEPIIKFNALNEIVISKSSIARIIEIETYINESYFCTFRADGLIVSTPTGSTAYSLAAGGPILCPNIQNTIIINPLCPHTLAVRPLIISAEESFTIRIKSFSRQINLTIDGQECYNLCENDIIQIEKSDEKTILVKSGKRNFYDVLKAKLNWIE